MNANDLKSYSGSEYPEYETLKYEIAENFDDILLNDSCDPDVNFFNLKTQNLDTPYVLPEEFKQFHNDPSHDSLSILHLNIRSIKKNFENFRLFLSTLDFSFSVLCFSETWLDDVSSNSLYELPNYISKHQIRDDRKGGGVSLYIHKSLSFKVIPDLCISSPDIEALTIEMSSNNQGNSLINVSYRPPSGKFEPFELFLNTLASSVRNSKKNIHIAGDFNLNLLDHDSNKKVQDFLNIIYRNSMIPIINKPTRVTRKTATAIDHILTNCFIDKFFKTAIFKSDISDHFPICFIIPSTKPKKKSKTSFIYKRILDYKAMSAFNNELHETNWKDIETISNPNDAYQVFLERFISLYDKHFPKKKIELKTKDLESPWITKGIKKSSKKKQRLYEKFLKKRTIESETEYKTYKRLYETIKKRSKKLHFSKLISKYKDNVKKTWTVIKDVIGKSKCTQNNFPKKIIHESKTITDSHIIAQKFNSFYTNIGPNLAKKIENSSISFESYIKKCKHKQPEQTLSVNELKVAFFSLDINKSPGFDDISFNVIKKCFSALHKPLLHIFNLSIIKGICPDDLKIARVIPSFKGGDDKELGNYRPISVLPCFSKILERIMYNRLYNHLIKNKLLYPKQFGFQKGHSTEHAIIHLVDQINDNFENNKFTLGVFIDLSKAFDTVDHKILLKKLNFYGVCGQNIQWYESYLTNRKQFLTFDNKNTDFENITCGVPQGSILGPLLFLIYVNDLCNASNILDPIMFADDTNLFYSHQNISSLFSTVNNELNKINEWFKANKLSLNVKKTKYTFFHKNSFKDNVPLKLPDLKIANMKIERTNAIKFLGVLLDENITWKNHIRTVEKKLAKNIGLLYRAKWLLDESSLKTIYFSYIHSYLNYANIAWGSTYRTNLRTIHYHQKHASRIVFNQDRLTHSRPLLRSLNALNIYQINLYQHLKFMHKVKNNEAPVAFQEIFTKPAHNYPTNFSYNNFTLKKFSLKSTKYSISFRGAKLWNELLTNEEKQIISHKLFSKMVKSKLLDAENELSYF